MGGLAAVIYIVPHLDTIVGLSLLVAAGAACCAWVAAGSVRSSYAGFQMALAFFIMLLPGFATSVDLVGIRDRFAGIIVGILAMWIFFDHLWHNVVAAADGGEAGGDFAAAGAGARAQFRPRSIRRRRGGG